MQHAERVQEPFPVTQLIAHAVHGNDFAVEID
jgi:hypothetical protein